jgi:glycosyltransferase involved in cell wall biosynthesis
MLDISSTAKNVLSHYTITFSCIYLDVLVTVLLLKFYVLFNISIMSLFVLSSRDQLVDVIVRTRNSEEFLRECLQSVLDDVPVRRIIVVDNGSTDKTIEIASSFEKVDIYLKPDLNLGQLTKHGFSVAETEWVAVIDSDMVLTKGWYEDMRRHMDISDAIEGCRVDHYRFDIPIVGGPLVIRREPVVNLELDLPFGEDAAMSYNFKKQGMKWEMVQNYLTNHYPKMEGYTHRRTGVVYRIVQVYVPKNVQIESGRIARRYNMISKREAFNRLMQHPLKDAYRSFRRNFWFCLAYFKII